MLLQFFRVSSKTIRFSINIYETLTIELRIYHKTFSYKFLVNILFSKKNKIVQNYFIHLATLMFYYYSNAFDKRLKVRETVRFIMYIEFNFLIKI